MSRGLGDVYKRQAIQLDTQKPVIDDNGGEYSNESNDNMTARAFWRDSDRKSK